MTSTVPRNPIDFDNPAAVRRFARFISVAIVLAAGAFALVVAKIAAGEPSSAAAPAFEPKEHRLYTPFTIAAGACVVLGSFIGARMHGLQGALADRCRRTLTLHIAGLALSEAAALLGLVLVFLTRSWEVGLPAAFGALGLFSSITRAEFRFGRLVEESAGSAESSVQDLDPK
jgi:F0F1-type ATP synthase membrane subunit c/vacuolar-type H+-ATPase subunit K